MDDIESPVTPAQRHHLVEVAAYYRAEHRSFAPGNELADWLEAEEEVDRMLAASVRPEPAGEVSLAQIQEGEPRSIVRQEALKRIIRQHPQREEPRVDSIEPEELRGE